MRSLSESSDSERNDMDAPQKQPLRVVLVEDSAVLRDILSAILGGISTLEIVGAADSEAAALALLAQVRPDLLIVDLELKAGTGLGILATIHAMPEHFGSPWAVVFSNHSHLALRARCRALGVAAFFDKSFQMDELLSYMDGVAGQGTPLAV